MPAGNNEKTARGRSFPPGVSGNPSGRPKIDPEVKEILKAASPDAARELVKLTHSKRENILLAAITEILDRTQGKPETMSKVELTGTNSGAVVFKWTTDEKSGNEDSP